MIPTLSLVIEKQMVTKPKPAGLAVMEGERIVGVLTLEEFDRVADRLRELREDL